MRNKVLFFFFLFFFISPPSFAWLEKSPLEIAFVDQQGYPPAVLSNGSRAEIFLVQEDGLLQCHQLNPGGEVIGVWDILELPYEVAYLRVKEETFGYLLYLVSSAPVGEQEWRILLLNKEKEVLSFFGAKAPLPEPRDLEVLLVDDILYVFTVEGRELALYWQRYNFSGEERGEAQIISSHLHVGVPRGVVDENAQVYLTWRRSQRYNGLMGYAIFQDGDVKKQGELGEYPYLYVVGLDTRPLVEEVGPSLVLREGGGFWVAWTHAYYEDFREWSFIQVLAVDSTGEKGYTYRIEGQDGFAVYPSLWKDERGDLHVAWEEKVGNSFDIFYASLDGGVIRPQRMTWSYSHHRLISGFSILDGLGLVGRRHTPKGDVIWYKSSFSPQEMGLRSFGIFGHTPGEQVGEVFLSIISLAIPLLLYLFGHWPLFLVLFILLLILRFFGILTSRPLGVLLPGILGILLLLSRLFSLPPPLFFLKEVGDPLLAYSQLFSTLLLLFYMRSRGREVFDEMTYLGYGLLWLFLGGVIAFFWQAGFVLTP